jgi:hypothetical protein
VQWRHAPLLVKRLESVALLAQPGVDERLLAADDGIAKAVVHTTVVLLVNEALRAAASA